MSPDKRIVDMYDMEIGRDVFPGTLRLRGQKRKSEIVSTFSEEPKPFRWPERNTNALLRDVGG